MRVVSTARPLCMRGSSAYQADWPQAPNSNAPQDGWLRSGGPVEVLTRRRPELHRRHSRKGIGVQVEIVCLRFATSTAVV